MLKHYKTLTFNALFAIIYTYGLFHFFVYCRDIDDFLQSTFNKLKYATVWCYIVQTVYFTLCTFNALNKCISNVSNSYFDGICNRLYISIVLPVAMVIVTVFWIIYSIDRELIFPRSYDSYIPSWQNHIMHTLPLFSTFIDNYLVQHSYPKFFDGIKLTMIYSVSYSVLTLFLAFVYQIWVYAFLEALSTFHRVIFYILLYLALIFCYKFGETLNSILWSEKKISKKSAD